MSHNHTTCSSCDGVGLFSSGKSRRDQNPPGGKRTLKQKFAGWSFGIVDHDDHGCACGHSYRFHDDRARCDSCGLEREGREFKHVPVKVKTAVTEAAAPSLPPRTRPSALAERAL